MPPKRTYSQREKRKIATATGSDADPNSANPKRSRRLSKRAALSQETTETGRGDPGNNICIDGMKRSGEGTKQTEVRDKGRDTKKNHRRSLEVRERDDLPGDPHLPEADAVGRSSTSEPSTLTINNPEASLRGNTGHDAMEASTEQITANHPSMMPVNVSQLDPEPLPEEEQESLPQEGAGAIEEADECLPRPAPSRVVGKRIHAEELDSLMRKDHHGDKQMEASNLGGNIALSSVERNRRSSLSDSEESPAKHQQVDRTSDLEKKVATLEKKIEDMQNGLSDKLDKVLDGLEAAKKGEGETDLKDVVHSLLYHLESNVSSNSYLANKILPLKMILNEGLHRKCVAKYIVDMLVMALETTPSLTPKCLNNIAEVLRIVLYSKSVGGKKDTNPEDEDVLEESLLDMKKKMTFIIVNILQNNPRTGTRTVSVDGSSMVVDKPSWLNPGFTSQKHINLFFSKNTRRKNMVKAGDRDTMCEMIIRTINEQHGKAFAKIRERIRVDTMKEVFFIFENFNISLVDARDVNDGPIDLRTIPLVNISRVPPAKVRKVVKKIWDSTVEIVENKLTYTFKYDADVKSKNGKVERRTLVRKMNFLFGAALILMRITGNGSLLDLLTYHQKIIRVIIAIAELLVTMTEVEFVAKESIDTKREDCPVGEDDYHILNVITCIRPTQMETRQEMVREHVLSITEETYEKLHYCEKDNDDDESDDDDIVEEEIVGDENEDEALFTEELNGALQFLSKI